MTPICPAKVLSRRPVILSFVSQRSAPQLQPIPAATDPPLKRKVASGVSAAWANPAITPKINKSSPIPFVLSCVWSLLRFCLPGARTETSSGQLWLTGSFYKSTAMGLLDLGPMPAFFLPLLSPLPKRSCLPDRF